MIVLAHPRRGSFNHAVAEEISLGLAQAGFDVRTHDLYAEGFDPVARADEVDAHRRPEEIWRAGDDVLVREHRRELSSAAILAVVHPNWWGKPPAMMSGWIDRVLIPGVAYTLEDPAGLPRSLLMVRALFIVNTSDTTAEREAEVFGDPLQLIWEKCIGSYLGDPIVERRILRTITDSTPLQRHDWLEQVHSDAYRIGAFLV